MIQSQSSAKLLESTRPRTILSVVQKGDRLAGRFEIDRLAATGGIGTVYRAIDLDRGTPVAVKVLRSAAREQVERFSREVRALAELQHASIVRYVTHGTTVEGQPFVVLEWLEGELLARRLARGDLSVPEALVLGKRVAGGLASAHVRGVVHRDINPSSLLLVDNKLEQAKILDFGLARYGEPVTTLSGTILGTPGYMAPEQARGALEIDARADVFALGCVLFKALTGKAPFEGENVVAVLAKVLFEQAPRPRKVRADIPRELDDLLTRMMAREPSDRPRDAKEVLKELEAIEFVPSEAVKPSWPPASVLTVEEQRLVSIVVALGRGDSSALERVRVVSAPLGAKVELLADGTMVAALWSKGSARDQATQAARCALAMREVLEGVPVALATGRAARAASGIMGEVIERATKLLRTNPRGAGGAGRRARLIALDSVTAGLLDVHFDVVGDGANLGLRRERPKDRIETTRTLLGRPTPFVGREREMGMLDAIFRECCADKVAHAMLVTAASGLGKSRLRHEFVQGVRREAKGVEIWVARGDPMSAGSPFGMLAQVVRATAGVLDGETLRTRQAKLSARVSRHLAGDDAQRVTEFLGELAGIRFPEAKSVPLQAARRSAVLMGDQMRRAWEDFLAAECAAQPVLLVLEDMHWGDLPTVSFLDGALRRLREMPLMVLATARPEVHQLFPQLWAGRAMTELRLGELSRKAAERLVRQVVGEAVSEETVGRVVEQAAGNAFYLEELIRSVVEGTDGELPGTVLAMVQGRLEGLNPEARRVLRAATVFGERFWRGAVTHLLQDAERTLSVGDWLVDLTKRELVQPQENGRYPEEYVFRHAIVREAAYGMLTEEDRVLGHRLAGMWLEGAGETDAMALAEQFERGAEPLRAVAWYRRAAEQALEGNDLSAVLARAKKGIACGAEGADRAALRVLQAEAHAWRGEIADSEACGLEALESAPQGSALWFDAAAEAASSAGRRGHYEPIVGLMGALCAKVTDPAAAQSQIAAWARVVVPLLHAGRPELAEKLFACIDQAEGVDGDGNPSVAPLVSARLHQARALKALFAGDQAGFLAHTEEAIVAFEGAGDLRSACLHTMNAGYAKMTLGAHAAAEVTLRGALATADRLGLPSVATVVRQNLGITLAHRGALHEARAVETLAIEGATQQGDTLTAATSRIYLAEILALARNFDAAERQLLAAFDALTTEPPIRAHALAVLARVRLALGRKAEAVAAATEAMQLLNELGTMPEGEAAVLLAYAEALRATGDVTGARSTIRDARARLNARAEKITGEDLRKSFLEKVPAHARTVELARELGLPST